MAGGDIRVMLVDDHVVVRVGLRALLEVAGGFQVVAEASSAAEAVEQARRASPDIVVMDVRLPDRSGVEACREIRAERPETRVLMLTSYPDEEAVTASVLAGASGYLLKEINQDRLLEALHIVSRGGSLLGPDLVCRVLERMRRQAEPEPDGTLSQLTPQERRILMLIAEGKTNREIGEELHFSENTVKAYVSRVLEKLGLQRRTAAAAFLARLERTEASG